MTGEEFAAIADSAFQPLVERHNLRPGPDPLGLSHARRFDGPETYLDVAWDYAGRRELGAYLCRHGEDDKTHLAGLQALEVSAALRTLGVPDANRAEYPGIVSDEGQVGAALARVAELLLLYGDPFFDGSDEPWQRARERLSTEAAEYTRQFTLDE